jgi:hypothetical protein
MPVNRDYNVKLMGNKWVHAIGEATCGCRWELEIKQAPGSGLSFRQCFDLYGAQFTIGVHDYNHMQACLEALPPGAITSGVEFSTDMTLGQLLEAS